MNTNTRKPGRNRGGRFAAVAVAIESLEGRSLFSATGLGETGALMSLGGTNAPVAEHHTGALRNVSNSSTPESTGALLNVSGSDTWAGLTADVPDAGAAASKATPKLFLICADGQH
jgi:hypothetical protein